MSLVLVCPPVIVVEKRVPIVTVKTCRLSKIYPSDNNVYQVEILEAPPVEIEISSQTQHQPYHS
jgi:hypothetical protein